MLNLSSDQTIIAQQTWQDYEAQQRRNEERRIRERAELEAQQAASWHERMLAEYPIPDEFRDAVETRFNTHGVGFALPNKTQISVFKNKPGHLAYTAYVQHPDSRDKQSFSDDDFEPLLYLALGCAVAIDVHSHDDFDALDEPTPDPQPPTPDPIPIMDAVDDILSIVRCEVERTVRKHPPINSLHEGFAVMLEELDQFWVEVKKAQDSRERNADATGELIQIAAMAIRTLADIPPVTDDEDC